MLNYILGVLTPFVAVLVFVLVRDTVELYRTVMKYGGENPRVLSPVGRVIQRILQALTGRRREV
jgi:hypothetical protein